MTTVGGGNSNVVYSYPDSCGDEYFSDGLKAPADNGSMVLDRYQRCWPSTTYRGATGDTGVGVCLFLCVAVLRLGHWY